MCVCTRARARVSYRNWEYIAFIFGEEIGPSTYLIRCESTWSGKYATNPHFPDSSFGILESYGTTVKNLCVCARASRARHTDDTQVSCRISSIIGLVVVKWEIDSTCVSAKHVRYVENNSVRSDWRSELTSHGGVNESISRAHRGWPLLEPSPINGPLSLDRSNYIF